MSSLKICLGGWGFVDPRGGRARDRDGIRSE
jgi:hypothetical protein